MAIKFITYIFFNIPSERCFLGMDVYVNSALRDVVH